MQLLDNVPYLLNCYEVSHAKILHCISKKCKIVYVHIFLMNFPQQKAILIHYKGFKDFSATSLLIRLHHLLLECKLGPVWCSVPSFLAVKRWCSLRPPFQRLLLLSKEILMESTYCSVTLSLKMERRNNILANRANLCAVLYKPLKARH